MLEAKVFTAWKKKVVKDLNDKNDPAIKAAIAQYERAEISTESTLLIAFMHQHNLPPERVELVFKHTNYGLCVSVRERLYSSADLEPMQPGYPEEPTVASELPAPTDPKDLPRFLVDYINEGKVAGHAR